MSDPSRLCSPCVQGLVSEMQSQGKEGRKRVMPSAQEIIMQSIVKAMMMMKEDETKC